MPTFNTLVLATNNAGKIAELTSLLAETSLKIQPLSNFALPEIEETGNTFRENALLKAQFYAAKTGLPCLADDSGLCVEALGGAPGVHTAEYGGIPKLLAEIRGETNRAAAFHCTLCLAFPDGAGPVFFEGQVKGEISNEIQGDSGFGYDPIFTPAGATKTYGQMAKAEKAATSHRSQALGYFKTYLSRP